MRSAPWTEVFKGQAPFRGSNRFHINAYSEFMPPPRLGVNPCTGEIDRELLDPASPYVWRISEFQEICKLRPGLEHVAKTVLDAVATALAGGRCKGMSKAELEGNPYWPPAPLPHKTRTLILPLALSRTQDDKGRVRWTLFGSSHLGPDTAFWRSFFTPEGEELPPEKGQAFLRKLLTASGDELPASGSLREAGLRLLTRAGDPSEADWPAPEIPSWAKELVANGDEIEQSSIKTLLTFRRFASLPEKLKEAALSGKTRIVPSPETMTFWNRRVSSRLEVGLPHATQIPLLALFRRNEGSGLRIPQSGLLHEGKHEAEPDSPSLQNSYRRSSRHDRHLRHMDILQFEGRETRLAKALFSSHPDDTGLYDKPMARNCQLWTSSYMPVLDGPTASPGELLCARSAILRGGTFGYRFVFPAMRIADYETFWHRPLVAVVREGEKPQILFDEAPSGVILAEKPGAGAAGRIELRPSFDARPEMAAAAKLTLNGPAKPHRREAAEAALHIFDAARALGGKIHEDAAAKVAMLKGTSVKPLLETLEKSADSPEAAKTIAAAIEGVLDKSPRPLPQALSFHRTANRKFEIDYWDAIRRLASQDFVNKNNADCILDEPSAKARAKTARGLDALGEYLLERHSAAIKKADVKGAFAGEIPFVWDGVYNFDWQEGWLDNRLGRKRERNLIAVIPGKDRSKAVILADHYDTAFMEDVFHKSAGGTGARIAAAGADDNHSATATLLLAAPIFLELAKEGKLGCDVWLVHLTGEEFPADCMGARRLAQLLVERRLAAMLSDGSRIDLSKTEAKAIFVMDMIAHNNAKEPNVFQISPGAWPSAVKAAMHVHFANEIWNALVPELNAMERRMELPPVERSPGNAAPPMGPFLSLSGQVRLSNSRRSSLYNTDGQIFSDAGLPAVLIMENYDLNRQGYHDTHDTLENIDLDFGAAVAAISIEAAAQAATE